ncbi:sporulation related protein [Dysgonomonas alginatilytica]|uniref:Sporulation related protein n=1 Tax=Dysgonomonas alginatilytica TaxID=1605892 RepID=A0A2V3PSJ6_9BACT|nr:SPOR domain-containing protein [Dysgonomonas alginatilytica]PXV61965.1 sporulation related protein [Dysgonomonas alginatilytica]
MKEFTSHIDYLIQKHDCVIIPDFGGFVLNREVAKVASDGSIVPPRVSVGFNPDLKYNDGLLAESYMNAYSISYDIACKRLTDVVKRLNTILSLRQPVQIGQLGKLSLDAEGRFNFETNNRLSSFHPETFGLSVLEMRRLVDIQEIQKISVITSKRSFYKRAFAGVGAAAAAILIFFVTSTPISENDNSNIQKSGFFTDLISTSATPANKPEATPVSNLLAVSSEESALTADADIEKPAVEIEVKKEEPKIEKVAPSVTQKAEPTKVTKAIVTETPKVKKSAEPKFFVIIGSAGSKSEAEKALSRFKNQGYKDANIVNAGDRNRIYIASFEDKTQAEKYLASFRKSNPKLNDAWVFTKRN